MSNFYDRQLNKAIERMKELNLMDEIIDSFYEEGIINKSEKGVLYWLDDDEEDFVKEWEEETGFIVYHAIYEETNFGDMFSLLYVSKYEEDWDMDMDQIEHGIVSAYVVNYSYPKNSEFGSIVVESKNGGLVRIG